MSINVILHFWKYDDITLLRLKPFFLHFIKTHIWQYISISPRGQDECRLSSGIDSTFNIQRTHVTTVRLGMLIEIIHGIVD